MPASVLTLNAGSSSVKFSIFTTGGAQGPVLDVHGEVEGIGVAPHLTVRDADGAILLDQKSEGLQEGHQGAVAAIHDWFHDHGSDEASFRAIGHRVVHGGPSYATPVLVTDAVMAELEILVPLAPLHQPHALATIRAVSAVAPGVPQVACFDTSFHAEQPVVAQRYALPRALTDKGIRRYGFHGLSYEFVTGRLAEIAPDGLPDRLVVAHLGNGASMCAIKAGRSIASTMGFTAVDGLPMGTRTGTLDPGVILYLMQHEAMDTAAIERLIYRESGLLGVSGISSDMRVLMASAEPAAAEAVDLFVYRIGRELGSLVAALGGLDALVFTGGIGEHAGAVRARVCTDAEWSGIAFDARANDAGASVISQSNSPVTVWVIPTDENLMIARHTLALLDEQERSS